MEAKALLLIDNCSAHAPIESLRTDDGKIVAMLLPPNVTAVIQPMDQNPIRIVKMKYRKLLVSKILANVGSDIHDLLKTHTIRDAILMLDSAWTETSQNVLKSAWSRISNWDDDQYDAEDELPISELIASGGEYRALAHELHQHLLAIAPDSDLTQEECDEWNDNDDRTDVDTGTGDESDESDIEIEPEIESVPYNDAINSVNRLIKWCEKNSQEGTKHLTGLLNLRSDIVAKHLLQPKIQKRLDDYFG